MYLRWMIRKDDRGVDFGLWQSIPPSVLSCPPDVHSGNIARKLGLLKGNRMISKLWLNWIKFSEYLTGMILSNTTLHYLD